MEGHRAGPILSIVYSSSHSMRKELLFHAYVAPDELSGTPQIALHSAMSNTLYTPRVTKMSARSRAFPIRRARVQLSYEGCIEFRHFVTDLLAQAPEPQERGRGRPRARRPYSHPPRSSSGAFQATVQRVLEYLWDCEGRGQSIERVEDLDIDIANLNEVQIGTMAGLVEVFRNPANLLLESTVRQMRLDMLSLIEGNGLNADHIFSHLQDLRRNRLMGVAAVSQWTCFLLYPFLALIAALLPIALFNVPFPFLSDFLHALSFLHAHVHIADISSLKRQTIPRIDTLPAGLTTTFRSHPRRHVKMAINLLASCHLPREAYRRACEQLGATRHTLSYEGDLEVARLLEKEFPCESPASEPTEQQRIRATRQYISSCWHYHETGTAPDIEGPILHDILSDRQQGSLFRIVLEYHELDSNYFPMPELARGIQGCGMSAPEILSYLDVKWNARQARLAARRRRRKELQEFISRLWLSCRNEPLAVTEVLLSVWPNERQSRALLAFIKGLQRDGPEYIPGPEVIVQLEGCGMTVEEISLQLATEWCRSEALVLEHQRRLHDTRRVLTIRYSQYVADTVDKAVEVVNGSLSDEQVTGLDLFVNDFHTEGSSYQPTEDVRKAIQGCGMSVQQILAWLEKEKRERQAFSTALPARNAE
ncbi:hypothetical protein AC579_10367 [Pseudocercospora musae]|uniref:Uncharacterized protein n=1 Tax=Pseudocercospora musae TaxID=113226 RepID=A0A139GZN3_9PEZI|nr:hypothetical protein AC579_10367 [Pseudocercospora musae]